MYLVSGATGNVGGEVVRALAARGMPVRALARGEGQGAGNVFPAGVEAVRGDLNEPASLRPALDGVIGLFLLPGYADMPGLLAEARRAGVRTVVQLSGASAGSGDLTNAITRYMTASEQAVRGSGITWTILRPAEFMSNAFRWIPQLAAGSVVRMPFGHVRAAVTDPADIGAVAAQALVTAGYEEQVYRLSGPQSLSQGERVAILGRVLHRDLRFEGQPDDEARAEMEKTTPEQYVDAFFSFYANGTLDESPVLPTVHALTGRPPRTFEQWATAHADAFR